MLWINLVNLFFCKKVISDFVKEYLKGDISALADFDFALLQDDIRFGCNGRHFDCDDTNLARAIYYMLWGDIFPDISLSDIGSGKKYRGDTLNTFNTVFGTYNLEKQTCMGIEKSNSPKDVCRLVNIFHANYHSIGNFILLPNIAETDRKRAYTFNTYRGVAYKDYFDLFLQQLYECLTFDKGDSHMLTLIVRNGFFFSWLKTKCGLEYLNKVCWLQDYFNGNSPQNVFLPHIYCSRKKREWTCFEKAYYIEHVEQYIIKATTIIKNRANKMLEKLVVSCN